ncbi:unnamed protein product [Rhodiola kirilowii]
MSLTGFDYDLILGRVVRCRLAMCRSGCRLVLLDRFGRTNHLLSLVFDSKNLLQIWVLQWIDSDIRRGTCIFIGISSKGNFRDFMPMLVAAFDAIWIIYLLY